MLTLSIADKCLFICEQNQIPYVTLITMLALAFKLQRSELPKFQLIAEFLESFYSAGCKYISFISTSKEKLQIL